MTSSSSQPVPAASTSNQASVSFPNLHRASRFLTMLPAELRKRVYELLLTTDDGHEIYLTPDEAYDHTIDGYGRHYPNVPRFSKGEPIPRNIPSGINIISVCKFINIEATPVLYWQNRFVICTYWSRKRLDQIGGPQGLRQLRKLRIIIHALSDAIDRRGSLSTWNTILQQCPNLKTIVLTTCSSMFDSNFFRGVNHLAGDIAIAKTGEGEKSSKPKLVVRVRVKANHTNFPWASAQILRTGIPLEGAVEIPRNMKVVMPPSIGGCELLYTGCMTLHQLMTIATYEEHGWHFEPNNMDKEIAETIVGDLVELKWVEGRINKKDGLAADGKVQD